MVKTKTDWKTDADDRSRQPVLPKDLSDTKIVLSQQRIRVFNLTYYPETQQEVNMETPEERLW